jgi:hypothetical protein
MTSSLSENLKLLSDLRVAELLLPSEYNANMRLIINALAEHLFEEQDIFDFWPLCPWADADFEFDGEWGLIIRLHFEDSGYEIEWYDLISFDFADNIEFDPDVAVIPVSQFITASDEILKKCIVKTVKDWCTECRKAFIAEVEDKVTDS